MAACFRYARYVLISVIPCLFLSAFITRIFHVGLDMYIDLSTIWWLFQRSSQRTVARLDCWRVIWSMITPSKGIRDKNYTYIYNYLCICMYICIYMCIVYLYIYIYVYVYIYICICVYLYFLYIYICIYMYVMYVCMYVCMVM